MKKDKTKDTKKESQVNEPQVSYGGNRIRFSTIETQNDILLEHSLSLTPVERLRVMRQLNDYAFKNIPRKKFSFKNARIIFTRYEYTPE